LLCLFCVFFFFLFVFIFVFVLSFIFFFYAVFLALFFLSCCIILAVYRYLTAPSKVLRATGQRIVASGNAASAWVTSDRHIIGVFKSGPFLDIKDWDAKRINVKPIVRRLDARILSEGPAQAAGSLEPYAISRDGTLFAWMRGGTLNVARLTGASQGLAVIAALPLRKVKVTSVFLLEDSLLVVIFEDGKLEAWKYLSNTKGLAGTWLEGNWPTWNFGRFLVAASFPARDIGVIRFTNDGDEISAKYYRINSPNGSVVTALSPEKIILGTTDGRVVQFQPPAKEGTLGSEEPLGTLENKGAGVHDLAFFNEDTLVAVGDFDGIYYKIGSMGFRQLLPSTPVHHLSINKDFLLFSTANTLEFAYLSVKAAILEDVVFWF